MPPDDYPPQFQFDTPPPFTYEQFSNQYFGKMLDIMEGPGAEFLRTLRGAEAEFLKRMFYLMAVVKIQQPDTGLPEMLYAVNYGMVRHFLDQGHTAEEARDQLSQVPWDFLPGLDTYSRETANAIAVRAFGDAVAGRPRSPLQ